MRRWCVLRCVLLILGLRSSSQRYHLGRGHHTPVLPLALFTGVRGRGILGSSLAGSCINPPHYPRNHPLPCPATPRPGRACNSGGWICAFVDALLIQTFVCSR